jgi:NADPH-dependent 2,4-dienoyl-CoA reductase/sulfur reductase-like enzyme
MRVVIVGAGPAGVSTVAETLRQHDRMCEIVMLTDEPYRALLATGHGRIFPHRPEGPPLAREDFPERMVRGLPSPSARSVALMPGDRVPCAFRMASSWPMTGW